MYAQPAAESPMRADVPVNPGEMQIQVDVTVVYAIN
jgi:uncharacterized protein YggE